MYIMLYNIEKMLNQIGLVPMLIIGLVILFIVWWIFKK